VNIYVIAESAPQQQFGMAILSVPAKPKET
jgi:hypothetical protein